MFIYCIRNIKTGEVVRGFESEDEAFNTVVDLELEDMLNDEFEFDTYLIYREEVEESA